MNTETIVISVGGSLIVPNQIDGAFLKKFKAFILKEIDAESVLLLLPVEEGRHDGTKMSPRK
jgi:hypothetical protein